MYSFPVGLCPSVGGGREKEMGEGKEGDRGNRGLPPGSERVSNKILEVRGCHLARHLYPYVVGSVVPLGFYI